ncbi:MAG: hypothetical protein HZB76_03680 [Chlamydiae bacterium]|nr:hypothetical protein [Chlamydiota bacterium]
MTKIERNNFNNVMVDSLQSNAEKKSKNVDFPKDTLNTHGKKLEKKVEHQVDQNQLKEMQNLINQKGHKPEKQHPLQCHANHDSWKIQFFRLFGYRYQFRWKVMCFHTGIGIMTANFSNSNLRRGLYNDY